ncbi:MAG: 30S ribosomal protein S8e [Nanoarchaeota archaeon]|nr:30S ribosomal protein S8e [Nanoarchaeota archaeon]
MFAHYKIHFKYKLNHLPAPSQKTISIVFDPERVGAPGQEGELRYQGKEINLGWITFPKLFKPQFKSSFMKLGKKISGGRYHKARKKKKYELGRTPRVVKLKETRKKTLRGRGGNKKTVLLGENKINLIDLKTKKSKVVKIKNVIETPSNKFLSRQNILTKGAIIETEAGKAKITNRPGQEGCVQGVLIKE